MPTYLDRTPVVAMDNLCLDVIVDVMKNLAEDLPTLKACSLLSSIWLIASRPFLFHTVYFSAETTDENAVAPAFYNKLRELVDDYPYLCAHIRRLTLRRDQKSQHGLAPNIQHGLTSPFMNLAPVVQALRQMPSLHTLSLAGISCTIDPAAPCAAQCASVRTLVLDSVYYFGDDFGYMSRLLLHFPGVADLEIRRCHGKYWQQGVAKGVPASVAQLRSLTVMGSWPLVFWTNLAESSIRSLETLDVSLSWLVLSGAADLAGALRRLLRSTSDSLLNLRLDLHVEQKDLEEADRVIVPCSSLRTLTFRVSLDRTGMPSWLYLTNLLSQSSSPHLHQVVVSLAGPDEYTTGELTPPWDEFQDACMELPALETVGFVKLPGRYRQMKLGEEKIRSSLPQLNTRGLLHVEL